MPGKLDTWVPKEHERHLFHEIYIDETSQNDHNFLVLGGIILPREVSGLFENVILEARRPGLCSLTAATTLQTRIQTKENFATTS
jgi:hypothetical protein